MRKRKTAKPVSHAKKIRGTYQRGNIFWFARMQNGRRTQVSLRTSDYGEAVLNAMKIVEHPFLTTNRERAIDDSARVL